MCNKFIDAGENKLFQQILMKKATCKRQNFYSLLVFLLMTIAVLIAVSIHYYLINYQAKQKHRKNKKSIKNCGVKSEI